MSKTIAIIGSSPNIIGRGFGNIIDKHDIIVRVNWNAIAFKDNTTDYGSRIDVWGYGRNAAILRHKRKFINPTLCDTLWSLGDQTFTNVTAITDMYKNVIVTPQHLVNTMPKELGHSRPTSGWWAIITAHHLYPDSVISLFGYSKECVDTTNAYTKSDIPKNFHNLDIEREYINKQEYILRY